MSAGALTKGLRYVRFGKFYDQTPGALEGIPFCLDITSDEYRALWPQGYEPWSAELEIFHNPFARFPFPARCCLKLRTGSMPAAKSLVSHTTRPQCCGLKL